MALLFQGARCPLCDEVLAAGSPIFATSGVAFPPEDPLWRFCDAGMHWRCYAVWPARARFARGYFEAMCEGAARNPCWGIVYRDCEVLVTVNPNPPVSAIAVDIAAIGDGPRIALDEWSAWLRTPTRADASGEVAREAVENARLRLQVLPDSPVELVARAEFPPPLPRLPPSRAEELASLRRFNARARHCSAIARSGGLACPRCGAVRDDHRFHDHSSRPGKSFFTCLGCAQSFTHEDVSAGG